MNSLYYGPGYHQARTEDSLKLAAVIGIIVGIIAFFVSGYMMITGQGKERIGFGIYFVFCIAALIGWGLVYKYNKELDDINLEIEKAAGTLEEDREDKEKMILVLQELEKQQKEIEDKKKTIQVVAWIGSAPSMLVAAAAFLAVVFAILFPPR